MGIIIKDMDQIRSMIFLQDCGRLKDLWEALSERVIKNTRVPGLIQPGDTQEWWHLIWERLSDAAFVMSINPTEELCQWLKNVTLEVCNKPEDEWIGPWFRKRTTPPIRMLETAHISVAIATVLDLCQDIFDDREIAIIKYALKDKGQKLCRAYLGKILSEKNHINNWFMVLLNGYGTTSVILDDKDAIKETIEYYKIAASLYNKDSYGESIQYCNYATIHLSYLYEILVRYDAELARKLDMSCFVRMIPWQVSSFMYMKSMPGLGEELYPRTVNFGDSSAIFRPTADILLQIASRAKELYPKEAGLAKWLFEQTYANPKLEPTELSSFGFVNTFQFFSLLLYNDTAKAISPEENKLPLLSSFETGSIIARDRWEEPTLILAVRGGFSQLNVTSHNHMDQNSFILSYLKERFFVDPGHCCYRLRTQSFSRKAVSHNTWIFEKEHEGRKVTIDQRMINGNIYNKTEFFNKKGIVKEIDGIYVISSDAANIYGSPITRAERIWIAAMPNVMFIVDRIESAEPIKVKSHFVLNNRDNKLKTNVAAETKLVFRRSPAAMKFFQVYSVSDGLENKCKLSFDWGYVHDYYHPLPNQKGQGAEGSALIYNYTSEDYKTNHLLIYAIAMEHIDGIRGWHIRQMPGNEFYVEPPSHEGGYSIVPENHNVLKIINKYTGQIYEITENQFVRV